MFHGSVCVFQLFANRSKVRGKAAVIAVPFEDKTLETSNLVVDFFDKSLNYLEMRLVDKIIARESQSAERLAIGNESWTSVTDWDKDWQLLRTY